MPYVTHTIIDRSGERSFTRHYLPAINAGNYAAITGNSLGENVGDLRLALAAVCNGNFVKHEVTAITQRANIIPTSDPNAQREIKVVIFCLDSTARRFTIEIPCPNLDLIGQQGTDEVDETVTEWTDLVAVLVQLARSPWGNTFTVTGGRIVGRRL
jgi:hypothetical protein